jgi:hypothetical protein
MILIRVFPKATYRSLMPFSCTVKPSPIGQHFRPLSDIRAKLAKPKWRGTFRVRCRRRGPRFALLPMGVILWRWEKRIFFCVGPNPGPGQPITADFATKTYGSKPISSRARTKNIFRSRVDWRINDSSNLRGKYRADARVNTHLRLEFGQRSLGDTQMDASPDSGLMLKLALLIILVIGSASLCSTSEKLQPQ